MTGADIEALLKAGARQEAGEALDAALIRHHHGGDAALMYDLHRIAACYWADEPGAEALHRTHAYVYALEAGLWQDAEALHEEMVATGADV